MNLSHRKGVDPTTVYRILSLGAGVQSSALIVASDRGLIPRFDRALFADTGSELPETYEWLMLLEGEIGIPIERVRRPGPSLFEHVMENLGGKRMENPPFSTRPEGDGVFRPVKGGRNPLMQKCTRAFKSRPLEARMRAIASGQPSGRVPAHVVVENARGISLDEAHRMKPSHLEWIQVTFPLITELRWRRSDCERYVEEELGAKPPKSACGGCPHATAERWEHIARTYPQSFRLLEHVDQHIRHLTPGAERPCFLHRSAMPLRAAVEWSKRERAENPGLFESEDFGCDEGLCGV